jgi:membrane-associated phospholipid phosphatase
VRVSEWIGVVYFAYLAAACARRRMAVALQALAIGGIVVVCARSAPDRVRDWMPLAYILAGYYLCAALFITPSAGTEAWLRAWDRRLLGDPAARFARWPRLVLAYLDVVYVGCFLLVPLGFALLALNGFSSRADTYWTIVMSAEFASFAPLAVVQTRPPWAVERGEAGPADRAIRRAAFAFVQRFTIRVNTFPSGHAAGSIAVALGVSAAMPTAGLVLLALAGTICVASVVGRYHYTIDVVAGVLVAAIVWTLTRV